ncbi:MAG TPA: segregation/condensation protein A [Steroidobacter sp.]
MSKSKPELKLVEDTGSQLQDEDLSIELPPQQSEMPFAVVEGEPMTQLPRDLYIPPDALQVFLTAFEGPLDLLLYLIRKQNLDILNIPIAEITRQYMQYIEVMAEMQLELAGEYLLMAAMLAEIKSRMLLPRPPTAEGQEEEDPRAELVRRLQEYERFKKAAEDIDRLTRLERDTMTASAELEERKVVTRPPDVTLKEMLDAFRDVLSRAEKFAHHHISRERLSQRERMTEILSRLQTVAFFEFSQLFKVEEGRMGVTVTFIAILELMKEGLIEIVQAEAYAPIHVRTAQRHLKVVQGGAAADLADQADAENAAALAQPELAGENDIPDEDDEPAADEAAIAVQAAVADVAAASSIAVDSVESDNPASESGFVDAAVSEALASTESAVDTIATEEAAQIEASAILEEPVVEEQPIAEGVVAFEDAGAEDSLDADPLAPVDVVEAVAESAAEVVAADEVIAADESHVVKEHVVEEHEIEEHVVPEHVIEEHIVPEPASEESVALAETAQVGDEIVADETVETTEEFVARIDETAEIADEGVVSDDLAATDVVIEDAQPLEAVAAEAEVAPALETIEVAAEDAQPEEQVDVVAEEGPTLETIEVAAEDVAAVETTNVLVEDAVAVETTELSVDDDTVTGSSSEADNSDAEPSR